ncbi:ABC-type dipeptide/oligopeptide/nickel transport systems, permease [Paracholeplasma brassicae]|uniref:ABC-type dipeptide/oligopeptide/nickel transport systems, permease n=1 Tax=Acholeplasma brassicae TaxID=61635 RepID=U4KTE2_9MOLU|nr:ABC transporter permease [Paracholeplasma brassicae]CCV66534.1 ABC-type dipeptide/oligopeptide/nickel transport systems, permease [Paracholeplasma brassicae]
MFKKRNEVIENLSRLPKTPFQEVLMSLKENKRFLVGFGFLVLVIIMALFADFIAPFGMKEQNLSNALAKPSLDHLFGTDHLGRDVFSRVVYGARTSLTIGLSAVSISLVIGGLLGVLAGYYKGLLDVVIMRVSDVLLSIPSILLAIAIVASFGAGMFNMIVAIAIGNIPIFARIIRSNVLALSEKQFIEASHALGSSNLRIIVSHIIPNTLSAIIVQSSLGIASAILSAAGLGFIGLGLESSVAEWGLMLSSGRAYIRTHTYLTIYPGLAIMFSILAFNMLGDGIRDALDPKMRER